MTTHGTYSAVVKYQQIKASIKMKYQGTGKWLQTSCSMDLKDKSRCDFIYRGIEVVATIKIIYLRIFRKPIKE